jgi:hypothetical protein
MIKINEEIKKEYPWGESAAWDSRTKIIADKVKMIGARSIMDLGGGFGNIMQYLPDSIEYKSIDTRPWTDKTIVADFNKGEYPFVEKSDVIVAQGIIEYLERADHFLFNIKKYADKMILSYIQTGGANWPVERKTRISFRGLETVLSEEGWNVVSTSLLTENQKIYFCKVREENMAEIEREEKKAVSEVVDLLNDLGQKLL